MRILADTHTLLWAVGAPERLGAGARAALLDDANEIAFSTASLWEIAIKLSLGRLELSPEWMTVLDEGRRTIGGRWLGIEVTHCRRVASLPSHHRDPLDRMLVAQALCEGMTLASKDSILAQYPVSVIWS